MNGLICLLVFCLLAVTALAALGLCRRLFSHELPEHMATLALLESQAQWERQCAALAAQLTWTDPGHGAHSLAGGCHAGRAAWNRAARHFADGTEAFAIAGCRS